MACCLTAPSHYRNQHWFALTQWGRVTHICVGNLTTVGSDNGLSPGRRQAIIWTNDGMLLNGPLWTNFSEILIEIPTFSFKKMRLKVSSAKMRPSRLGLNVLIGFPGTWDNFNRKGSRIQSKTWVRESCFQNYGRISQGPMSYRKVSNIRHTKYQNLNASRLIW